MIHHFTKCIYRVSCFNYFFQFLLEILIDMVYNILVGFGYSHDTLIIPQKKTAVLLFGKIAAFFLGDFFYSPLSCYISITWLISEIPVNQSIKNPAMVS